MLIGGSQDLVIEPGEVVALLRARLRGFRVEPSKRDGVTLAELDALAEQCRNAKYGVVVWALSLAPMAKVSGLRETSILFAAILPIAGMDVFLEWKSESALAALRKLTVRRARVWRDGELAEMPATELVPGDLIVLQEGDLVPADARLVLSTDIQLDESALTRALTEEDGPNVEVVPFDRIAERLAYHDHAKVSPPQWRDRIAARQAAVAERMLG